MKLNIDSEQQPKGNIVLQNYESIMKKYKIKPCAVKLKKNTFSKIRMGISVDSSEKGVKLSCVLNQVNTNTFTLQIKRKNYENATGPVVPLQENLNSALHEINGSETSFTGGTYLEYFTVYYTGISFF